MKIAIINAVYGIMSTGRTYRELHDFLVVQGHTCRVYYGECKTDLSTDAIYVGNTVSHKWHALMSRITGKVGCYSHHATRKLIKALKAYQPDVVHLGNLHGNFVHIPKLLRYLAKSKTPTVVTLHDCYFFTGGCTHYTLNNCFRWEDECRHCPHYKDFPAWFFDRSNYLFNYKKNLFNQNSSLGVIAVSEWLKNEALRSPIFKSAKDIRTIYNWIDTQTFSPQAGAQGEKSSSRPIVLGVSSVWSNQKGLGDFIDLANRLGNDATVMLVGNMPAETALPDNVVHIPATHSTKDLAKHYAQADVFVQLSKEETFGKVVAESLSCGTPAVVYASTASPELVSDGCGIAVPPKEGVEGIYRAVTEVLSKGKEAFTASCRAKAKSSFQKDTNMQRILEFYAKL